MTMRILGLGAGAPGGSAEILLKEALKAAQSDDVAVELVRLDELRYGTGAGRTGDDDLRWLWERLLDCDGLVVSAPIFSRTVPAVVKVVVDRLLGPNADAAIVRTMLDMQARGEQPAMAFRLDERVLKPRVAGLMAVGGSLVGRWHTLALPVLHTLTFSMQTAVVDQLVVSGCGTPKSVVLDTAALERAGQLGRHVAGQLGRPFDEAVYAGEPGVCPLCHLSVIELRGREVECATCGAQGLLQSDGSVEWTSLDTSVITMAEKHEHYREIIETAQRHGAERSRIDGLAAAYDSFDPVVHPEGN